MTSLASIGATLVIASSESGVSAAGRLLSLRPLVFVGLISYSLYLWHWPLIVFQRTDALLLCRRTGLTTAAAGRSWSALPCCRGNSSRSRSAPRPRNRSKAVVFGTASAAMARRLALCGGRCSWTAARRSAFPNGWRRSAPILPMILAAAFRTGQCYLLDQPPASRRRELHEAGSERGRTIFWSATATPRTCGLGCPKPMPDVNVMQATASALPPRGAVRVALRYRACAEADASSFSMTFLRTTRSTRFCSPRRGRTRIFRSCRPRSRC